MKEQALNLTEQLSSFQKQCCKELKARACTLALYDDASKQLLGRIFPEKRGALSTPLLIPFGEGLLGLSAKQQKPISVANLAKDPRRLAGVDDQGNTKAVSLLSIPMKLDGKLIGIVAVLDKGGGKPFSHGDQNQLKKLAEGVVETIHATQQKDARIQQLRQQAIYSVISGLSHYLKHLLHGISTGAALVDSAMKERNMTLLKKGWQVARSNEKKIANMVRDLIYLTGEKKGSHIPTNIADLLKDVYTIMKRPALEKNISIKLNLAEELPEVPADPVALHRALHHLVANAIDAIDKSPGRVLINAHPHPPILRIEVQDNGHGIPAENLPHIFEPFFSTKEHLGTGIGLAVTKKVVEEIGGQIEVLSQPGKGTSFILKLPLKMAEKAAAKKPSKKGKKK